MMRRFLSLVCLMLSGVVFAQVKVELAGNPLTAYPWFEYVKAFNFDAPVSIAVDPTLHPEVVGKNAKIWVVEARTAAQWQHNLALQDVRPDGPQLFTFSGSTIQDNTVVIAAAGVLDWHAAEQATHANTGLGHGYDIVVDLDQDGTLDAEDLADGVSDEAGLYVVGDTTKAGPLAVTSVPPYSVGTVFGIPADETKEVLYYPTLIRDMDPRPLVVIGHGSGHDFTWYDHIGEHLASWGYIVMSHQNMDVYVTHRHTDAFLSQQGTIAGGVLNGKIDDKRIIWIGHSFGAISITRAYDKIVNGQYVPTHYTKDSLILLSSMLPPGGTGDDGARPHDVNFHLWTASGDAQVSGAANCDLCQTYQLYERAKGWRLSTTVQGTGHAWFHNGTEPWGDSFEGPCSIGKEGTHLVQLGLFLPLVKFFAEGNIPATDYFWRQYERFHPSGVDTSNPCFVVTNEWRPHPDSGIVAIDDFQTEPSSLISSSGGAVTMSVEHFKEGRLDDNNNDFSWVTSDLFNGATQCGPKDDYRGAVFDWDGADKMYEWQIVSQLQDFSRYAFLSFRAAQGTQHPATVKTLGDLDFTVTLKDAGGHESSIKIGTYGGGIEEPYARRSGWHNEMERVRLRLRDFLTNDSKLDLAHITAVRFDFGPSKGSAEGRLVLDELFLEPDASDMHLGCVIGATQITAITKSGADELRFTWDAVSGQVNSYNFYVGTLASLHGSGRYDHVKNPGGTTQFPDSPTTDTGCDVSGGTATTARVRYSASGSYFLIVGFGGDSCEGPYGKRSDGKDRHDKAVDPRPAAAFCP